MGISGFPVFLYFFGFSFYYHFIDFTLKIPPRKTQFSSFSSFSVPVSLKRNSNDQTTQVSINYSFKTKLITSNANKFNKQVSNKMIEKVNLH